LYEVDPDKRWTDVPGSEGYNQVLYIARSFVMSATSKVDVAPDDNCIPGQDI
jgi:hypothetical protein